KPDGRSRTMRQLGTSVLAPMGERPGCKRTRNSTAQSELAHLAGSWRDRHAIHRAHLRETRALARFEVRSADAVRRDQGERDMHANARKLLFAAAIIGATQSAFANVITDWDVKALAAVAPMTSLGGTELHRAQRLIGMVHIAMFDAVNSIERRYRPYLVQLPADAGTSQQAAAAAAAAAVLT